MSCCQAVQGFCHNGKGFRNWRRDNKRTRYSHAYCKLLTFTTSMLQFKRLASQTLISTWDANGF